MSARPRRNGGTPLSARCLARVAAHSERERAALAWTEALTLISQTHVPDAVYDEVRRQFAEEELVKLTLLVATINAWNRIAISFRSVHPVRPPVRQRKS